MASMAFILSASAMSAALSAGSGIGLSLMAVNELRAALYEDADARTMAWMASGDNCDGGSDGSGVWKKSGWFLSGPFVSRLVAGPPVEETHRS